MKRVLVLVYILSVLLALPACRAESKGLALQPDVALALNKMDISGSSIIKLGKYQGLSFEDPETQTTQAEVDAYIETVLDDNIEVIELPRNTVQIGDRVSLTYRITVQEAVVNDDRETFFVVGDGTFHSDLEQFLVGKQVGTEYIYEGYTIPQDDDYGNFAGKDALVFCTVNYIYELERPELTDAYVQEKFGVSSVAEYETQIRAQLEAEKAAQDRMAIANQLMEEVIENSTFSLAQDDINTYGLRLNAGELNQAVSLGSGSIEDYDAHLDDVYGSSEIYYTQLYDQAVQAISYFLVVGAIAEKEGLTPTPETVEAYCTAIGLDATTLSENETAYVNYYAVEGEVIDFILNAAGYTS